MVPLEPDLKALLPASFLKRLPGPFGKFLLNIDVVDRYPLKEVIEMLSSRNDEQYSK